MDSAVYFKATGIGDIAYCMLGRSLKEQGILSCIEEKSCYVKHLHFLFQAPGMDTYLSPEMKSTGEARI